jgi:hypothetical protein
MVYTDAVSDVGGVAHDFGERRFFVGTAVFP